MSIRIRASTYLHGKALTAAALETLLDECALTGGSAVVWGLDGSTPISVRSDANLYPASMIKLPIALALDRMALAGRVSLDDRTRVRPESVTVNDAPSPFVAGYETSLRACAEAMLTLSDNVATNALIDALGRDVITRECEALALRGTAVRRKLSGALPLIADPEATGRNAHPASDCARLLARVAQDASRGGSWIYDALLAQYWNDKLPRGWDPGDTFAHKTGDTDDASHDGGILTLPGGRRYVVVVYTPLASCPATDEKLAGFARRLRPLLADRP